MPAVTARPIAMTRVAIALAVALLAVFGTVALVMPTANAGATFGLRDQLATALLGVLAATAVFPLTRPRLMADEVSLRIRGCYGGWRTLPWDLVVAVEFPSSVRFARVVLPGEETLAVYAVQRMDRDKSVAVMRSLRELLAHVRADGSAPAPT